MYVQAVGAEIYSQLLICRKRNTMGTALGNRKGEDLIPRNVAEEGSLVLERYWVVSRRGGVSVDYIPKAECRFGRWCASNLWHWCLKGTRFGCVVDRRGLRVLSKILEVRFAVIELLLR